MEVSKQELKNCIYGHAEYLAVALRGAWDSQGDLGKYRTDIDVPYNYENADEYKGCVMTVMNILYEAYLDNSAIGD